MTTTADSGLGRLHPVIVHHLVNTLGWTSLRPLQDQAIAPVLDGNDALLRAPTAGGRQSRRLPGATAMEHQRWDGLSVLYVCPRKALLNVCSLGWKATSRGSAAGLRSGTATRERHQEGDPHPRADVLLTTPESLESMLVSPTVDHRRLFAGLRVVIVDEVHAFGGDDRGWHLLAVLERLTRIVDRPIQRIGLSATVGNPSQLLHWLQGSAAQTQPGVVVAPEAEGGGAAVARERSEEKIVAPSLDADVQLDYVGSAENAAKVIAALYRGEKRLVFCDSKRLVEQLGALLRERGVTTYLVHASLSLDERRRAERAFAEGRDCVIVSTSALELGLDVGDLDRVIQVNAPPSVAAFLQRIGRSGRRPGTRRSCLLLALRETDLLVAAGLLLAWSKGFVEPIAAPAEPRHIVAQQLLALCLQEGQVGENTWQEWLPLPSLTVSAQPIAAYLVAQGFLTGITGCCSSGQKPSSGSGDGTS